jgi:hypothetical protein
MKKLLPFLSLAVLMTACSPNTKESPATSAAEQQLQAYKDSIKRTADTAGLAQFQQWKAQNELTATEQYNEPVAQYDAPAKAPAAKKVTKAPVHKASKPAPVATEPAPETPAVSTGSGDDVAMGNESAEEAKAEQKEGWSKAAKGAVIGGAGGAAAGAVIFKKNRALGAAIGGVIGAGGGYVIGRKMDKKDGRVE